MKFRPHGFYPYILSIAIAVVASAVTAHAQFSISLSTSDSTTQNAPSGEIDFLATASNSGSSITKIVFYRNNVPYKTFVGSDTSRVLTENELGEDTYKYRARAYNATTFVDSNEIQVTINTPFVFKMGQTIPAFDIYSSMATSGPGRATDHTEQIKRAVKYLNHRGGGTLYFPCTPAPYPWDPNTIDPISMYNVHDSVTIPENVSLVGESSEEYGRCRMNWRDVRWNPTPSPTPTPPTTPDPNATPIPDPRCHNNTHPAQPEPGNLEDKAMFQILGNTKRVRIKDLFLYSLASGPDCYPRSDYARIASENAVAVGLYADDGHVRDVVLENVSMTGFTFGVRASACTDYEDFEDCTQTNNEITGIRMRGIKPSINHRQLFVNARYAYDWDVQNFNISTMAGGQGAVEIVEAGKPGSPVSENTQLKFLELNCNAFSTEAFCVKVQKHGGLYFKLLHAEGPRHAFDVVDMGFVQNSDPIILEASVATGLFKDASMDLYMVGNFAGAAPEPDETRWGGRMEFEGAGVQADVYDCGDVWGDRTDVDPADDPAWEDWQMSFTHTERNRVTFFARNSEDEPVYKPHTPCPANIDDIGGDFFDTGVMPTELLYDSNGPNTSGGDMLPAYTWPIVYQPCGIVPNTVDITDELEDALAERGTVYVDGCVEITRNLVIPSGKQVIGGPNLEIFYDGSEASVFTINAPLVNRTTSVILRNLKMTGSGTKAAISMLGVASGVGLLSDVHLSGLTITNFGTGLAIDPDDYNPMLDGVSLKNSTLSSNQDSVKVFSDNTSNWNIQNLTMQSDESGAIGLRTVAAGLSVQGVACRGGDTNPMVNCIDVKAAISVINGFRPAEHVTNSITVQEGYTMFDQSVYEGRIPSTLLLRNSDFRTSDEDAAKINLLGKAFITSMNNKYENFYIANPTPPGGEGPHSEYSRVTVCGDIYETTGNKPYPGLEDEYPNIWVGVPTPTVVECSSDPYAYEDPLRHGGNYDNDPSPSVRNEDQPMVGNFYDDVREDYVIYRPGQTTSAQSYFLIKQAGGDNSTSVAWGVHGDVAMVGKVFENIDTAQIIIYRAGAWWVKDPQVTDPGNATSNVYSWGTTGDIPFVGNFVDDADDLDELAIYRPSTDTFWILNPRNSSYFTISRAAEYGNNIVVADFLGEGYEQIAQYDAGTWNIVDPDGGATYSPTLGGANDVPVPAKYLSGDCAQLAVWDPDTQEFIMKDMPLSGDPCGTRTNVRIFWGSNNDLVLPYNLPGGGTRSNACPTTFNNVTLKDDDCPGGDCANDIPLHINTDNPSSDLRKPVSYRQSKGHYYCGVANGQWWIHDLVIP